MTVSDSSSTNSARTFESHRDRLFAIAYRMLGSRADAEDIVQEAFLRWQQVRHDAIDAPGAFLTTVVTRLCIDHQRAARVQREEYIGPWLPEPLVTDDDPARHAELADSLSMAFLLMLETLTPLQRAVFLLREVFGYDYRAVAETVGKSESYCRKLAQRARTHLADRTPRFDTSEEQRDRLLRQFMQAVEGGDLDVLLDMLAEDITLHSDGGGRVTSALKPIYGADRVARFLLGIRGQVAGELAVHLVTVNGGPGFVVSIDGERHSVWSFHVEGGRIQGIYVVLNPEKLEGVDAAGR